MSCFFCKSTKQVSEKFKRGIHIIIDRPSRRKKCSGDLACSYIGTEEIVQRFASYSAHCIQLLS